MFLCFHEIDSTLRGLKCAVYFHILEHHVLKIIRLSLRQKKRKMQTLKKLNDHCKFKLTFQNQMFRICRTRKSWVSRKYDIWQIRETWLYCESLFPRSTTLTWQQHKLFYRWNFLPLKYLLPVNWRKMIVFEKIVEEKWLNSEEG